MSPKKKKATSEVKSGLDLFGFINAIYQDQRIDFFDELSDDDKKKYRYSRYMIHRFISMRADYIPVVNALQQYTGIPDRAHYLFLTNMLPRGKQFSKYIKGDKEDKYDPTLVDLVKSHFQVSKAEAITYLTILYEQDKPALRELCELYGADPKTLKRYKV